MTQSAGPDILGGYPCESRNLKKGDMTCDDVISQMADDENWDVEKLDANLDQIEKKSKFYSFEEVFKDV